ncbi:MAG: molecular chaperone HscC [Leptospirales bacterium]|nr:molecular chaperone HscC [Leptospirales bacterium]
MIIGIDLGTSNSLVGWMDEGKPRLLPNSHGKFLTPSSVGIDQSGEVVTGAVARDRQVTAPNLTSSGFKRFMGTAKTLRLGKKEFRPEELSALILKSLKADAERALGQPVNEAVITVPAYFRDAQRKATRTAGELAGLQVRRLLNEPTAAALSYGLNLEEEEQRVLIFDLGGGTFDVSILEYFEGVMEVRATAGDNFLGGDDFVTAIAADMKRKLDIRSMSLEAQSMIQAFAESVKVRLTDQPEVSVAFEMDGKSYSYRLTRDEFQELSAPLVEKLRRPVEQALRDSRIRARELDQVLLVGGATRMPMIRDLVARMFGRLPSFGLQPDEAVALGATIAAGLEMKDVSLQERVLTDVAPFTLGISVAERVSEKEYEWNVLLPIIERNTVIPASRVKNICTVQDNQKEMHISIFQGENRSATENVKIGSIRIPVPRDKAEAQSADIRFTYDVNGVLEVQAHVTSTGKEVRVVIEEAPGMMAREEIEKRLKQLEHLKIAPADAAENRALLSRAERVYSQSLKHKREYVSQMIAEFKAVLNRQDPNEIAQMRDRMAAQLDEIEEDPFG